SIVVSTPRCGRGDTGSIPVLGINDRNSCQRMQKFRFRRRTQPFSTLLNAENDCSCPRLLAQSRKDGTSRSVVGTPRYVRGDTFPICRFSSSDKGSIRISSF
uniref:Uncharacterized protein n=1 Tax=Parascaris univalens TaxID=6257 RepID=A0A915A756_PARUN